MVQNASPYQREVRVPMAKSYEQIRAEIAALEKQADSVRATEKSEAVEKVRKLVEQYGLSMHDIGMRTFGKRQFGKESAKLSTGSKKVYPPKYRDPVSGKEWSGMGKPPMWIAAATKEGSRDDLLISGKKKAPSWQAPKKAEAKPQLARQRAGSP